MNISQLTGQDKFGNQTWESVQAKTDVPTLIGEGARINVYGTAVELATVSAFLTQANMTAVERKTLNKRTGKEEQYLAINCNPPATAADFGF